MRVMRVNGGRGLADLKLTEESEPGLPTGRQVLVRWRASSLNYHDYLVAVGGLPVEPGRIPLSDGAGEVLAVGGEVSEFGGGDRVMSSFFPEWVDGSPTERNMAIVSGETVDGFAAEQSLVNASSLTKMPVGYSFSEAATLPCAALTAWRALVVEGGIKAGDVVLVEGTGGMSVFALQLAKLTGAKVVATTSSDEKVARLKQLGADMVINYVDEPKWGDEVYRQTGGADHVLDVGGGATMQQSISAVKVGGSVCSIGILGGPKGTLLFPKLFFKQVRLTGLAVGSVAMQNDMLRAIEACDMGPVIDKEFALTDLAKAFEYQATGGHFGKIVITI